MTDQAESCILQGKKRIRKEGLAIKRRIGAQIAACLLIIALFSSAGAEAPDDIYEEFTYGYSQSGRPLICYRIGEEDAAQSLLMIFGVHGFEDSFDHDGEILRQIAGKIIQHYAENAGALKDFRLYIVPSANPDGLIDGNTKDGFGRCNAMGLDINRDFPIGWIKRTEKRNKTGSQPFSTAEARAIRDLVEGIRPDYAMDIHGWISASYGDGEMAKVFAKPFGFSVKIPRSGGMLCSWLDTVTKEAIMLELPGKPRQDGYVDQNSKRLIEGIDQWIAQCTPE